MKAQRSSRGRDRLDDARVALIVTIIETWDGKISGEALAERVSAQLGIRCTRPGLMKNETIRRTYDRRVSDQKSGRRRREPDAATRQLQNHIEKLKAHIDEKDEVIRAFKERFVLLIHNARAHGMTVEQLELPMPPVR